MIKANVIKTLVDKKKFTRQDIYKAIYNAQGKKMPDRVPVGFYGTNINHWERDLLIERVSRGNYIIGKKAEVYLQFPKIYRKYIKADRKPKQNFYHQQWTTNFEHKNLVVNKYKELKTLVEKLFQSMDENTTSLWADDLQFTVECVVLEDTDGVKVDENDNPTFKTNGYCIEHLMNKIRKQHLNI